VRKKSLLHFVQTEGCRQAERALGKKFMEVTAFLYKNSRRK
jgi:hypothetical protein